MLPMMVATCFYLHVYYIYTVYIEYIYIYIYKSLDSLDFVSVLYGTSEAVCFSSCMIRILLDRQFSTLVDTRQCFSSIFEATTKRAHLPPLFFFQHANFHGCCGWCHRRSCFLYLQETYKAKYLVSADRIFLLKRTEGEDTLRSFDRTSIHKSRLFR